MTPEPRQVLQTLFDQVPEGSEAVVPRLTDPTTNLRTTFMKLIARWWRRSTPCRRGTRSLSSP